MNTINKFFKLVKDRIKEEMEESVRLGDTSCDILYNTNDGAVEVEVNNSGKAMVWVTSVSGREHPNIESRVSAELPKWYDVEARSQSEKDYWSDHGFASQQDYLSWRYGGPRRW